MIQKTRSGREILAAIGLLLGGMASQVQASDEILVKDGQKVAFLGDSITAGGWSSQGGYVKLVVDGLAQKGIKVTPIPAGVGGNKSNDMLARLEKDVLSQNPDWMTLSCGVNDVWHGPKGVDLETYKKNITSIVDQAEAKGIKVVLLTATVIGEEANDNNTKLLPYNEFLRSFAHERKLPLADLNPAFHAVLDPLSPTKDSRYLTVDGVHMNPEGNVLMAKGCLGALGFSKDSLDQLEETWIGQKNTATITVYPYDPRPDLGITLGQYRGLAKMAATYKVSTVELGRSLWLQAMAEAVQAHKDEPVLNAEVVKKEAQGILEAKISKLVSTP